MIALKCLEKSLLFISIKSKLIIIMYEIFFILQGKALVRCFAHYSSYINKLRTRTAALIRFALNLYFYFLLYPVITSHRAHFYSSALLKIICTRLISHKIPINRWCNYLYSSIFYIDKIDKN